MLPPTKGWHLNVFVPNKGIEIKKVEGLFGRVVSRANNNSNANGGVAYANSNNASSNSNSNNGSRLANSQQKDEIYYSEQSFLCDYHVW